MGNEPQEADTKQAEAVAAFAQELEGGAADGGGDSQQTTPPEAPPPSPPPEAPPAAGPPPAPPAAEARRYATPDGRHLTLAEAEAEGLVERAFTHLGQVSHYQQLAEAREVEAGRLRSELETVKKPPEPPAPPRPRLTPQQMQSTMQPAVQGMVKAGWMTEDFAELYPVEAAQMVAIPQQATAALKVMSDRVAALEQQLAELVGGVQHSLNRSAGEQLVGAVVGEGDVFAELKEPETLKKFQGWLKAENLDGLPATPKALRLAYLAYRQENAPPAVPPPTRRPDAARREAELARGEGAGGGGGAGTPSGPEQFAQELASIGVTV